MSWAETDSTHSLALALLDNKGKPVEGGNGEQGITLQGNLQTVRPPGVLLGDPVTVAMVLPIPPIVMAPGKYAWHLTIDGVSNIDWELPFTVAASLPYQLAS